MPLSCYQGDGSIKSTCPSVVKAKYCTKITLEPAKIAGYSCLAEPYEQLGLDKSTIKHTLTCYNRTVYPLKGEYCFCTKDNCNDPSSSSSSSFSSSDASSKNSTALKVGKLRVYMN